MLKIVNEFDQEMHFTSQNDLDIKIAEYNLLHALTYLEVRCILSIYRAAVRESEVLELDN